MSYSIASSTSDVRAVIEPEVETMWIALGYTADTIEWPNTYFVKPGNGAWIRVSYPQQSTFPYTWGGPANVVQNTTIGLLTIQVFAPKNAGAAVLVGAVDAFRSTFERRSFGDGIRFREATGPSETFFDASWAAISLSFPFEFIENIQQ